MADCCLQGYAAREFVKQGLQPGELAIISKEAVSCSSALSLDIVAILCSYFSADNVIKFMQIFYALSSWAYVLINHHLFCYGFKL